MSLACLFEAERIYGQSEVSFQSKLACLSQNGWVVMFAVLLGVGVILWAFVELKIDAERKETEKK